MRAQPRWLTGSRSLLTMVCMKFTFATALARTLGVFTSTTKPCRASSTCWPKTARPTMPVTAWPRSMGIRSLGTKGPQRRIYEFMSICNEVIWYQVPLHPFHRLVYTNALLFPVRGTETFEAAANSFCRLLRNWPKADFLARSVATDLVVPIGHDAGLAEYLDQLTLVAAEENHAVDEDHSPRMSELPNPFRVLMFATGRRRAADTRFFRGRGLPPTEWSAGFLRAPNSFDLSRWLPPVPDWEPKTDLRMETPVMVSYLADSLRNEYTFFPGRLCTRSTTAI